ncbi:glyoxalase [Nocardia arthritidis]|uniref:Glyoxalase n=1 Tax=Nocardia arthritidis TaxID=228602 RepID=A0A6G9YIT2_9NOCA|nr:glyoxalase [Nocardia arthritidis]QIS13101.1 glyoxalase [Nocardia arthritidis]
MSDTSVPVLRSGDLSNTLDFYRALGYQVTHEQTRPYAYGVVTANGCEVHFAAGPKTADNSGDAGCLIMVDDVAARHRDFSAALRARYGKVPSKGNPRITRFRPGQTRFTLVDPAGNWIIYIQRDEPVELEYGGSSELSGLAKVLDNARILRDFKNDDSAAARTLEVGLGRHGAQAPAVDRARALAALTELSIATGDSARAERFRAELRGIELTKTERASVAAELRAATDLEAWLTETS